MHRIRQHLDNIVIEVSNDINTPCHQNQEQHTKYKMVNGIPQGSILSSVLCDLYYGDMENKYLSPRLVNSPGMLNFLSHRNICHAGRSICWPFFVCKFKKRPCIGLKKR